MGSNAYAADLSRDFLEAARGRLAAAQAVPGDGPIQNDLWWALNDLCHAVDQLAKVTLGPRVTIHVTCPSCDFEYSWQQYERERGRFDGLCRVCGTRCITSGVAVVAQGNSVDEGRECPGCHPSGGERYRRGEDIRQREDGSLTCLACGRVVIPAEAPDGG